MASSLDGFEAPGPNDGSPVVAWAGDDGSSVRTGSGMPIASSPRVGSSSASLAIGAAPAVGVDAVAGASGTLIDPPPRCIGVGIANAGNTCFASAVVQLLLSCPLFWAQLQAVCMSRFGADDAFPPTSRAVIRLWQALVDVGQSGVLAMVDARRSLAELFAAVGHGDWRLGVQHDAVEFLVLILQSLDVETGGGVVSALFGVTVVSTLERACGHASDMCATEMTLAVPLLPERSVCELLAMHGATETLVGVACGVDGCAGGNADKRFALCGASAYVLVSVKRFEFDGVAGRRLD